MGWQSEGTDGSELSLSPSAYRALVVIAQVRKHALDKTETAVRAAYDKPAANRTLRSVQLFDDSRVPAKRFHLVLCLDESGSMRGQKWADVLAAYKTLLSRRMNDQGLGDLVSVVTFSLTAETRFSQQPIEAAPRTFTYSGGRTRFAPALQAASEAMARQPADVTPLLVFMSDGKPEDGRAATAKMRALVAAYRGRNLQVGGRQQASPCRAMHLPHECSVARMCPMRRPRVTLLLPSRQVHTIGFRAGIGEDMLRSMAEAAGGRFHSCQSGVDLAATFAAIAAESTAMDGLVARFAEILSEQIALKVVLDFL